MKFCQLLQDQVLHSLRANGADSAAISSVVNVFTQKQLITPFDGLMTFQQQLKYYRENFYFVVSQMVFIMLYIQYYVPL